jgi:SAM-dependent methyltransferase
VATDKTLVERTPMGLHPALTPHLRQLRRNVPVLDLGCGTGAWIERLADEGFTDLTGVDADGVQFGATRARLVVADLNRDELDIPSAHFGLITSIEVLEHLENPGHFFGLIKRHLAPDGTCLITTPNVHSLNCRLRFLVTGRLPAFDDKGEPSHINPVVFTCLERVLRGYHLEVRSRWTYPERGTTWFSRRVRLASAAARLVLRDPLPGDILCLQIKHLAHAGSA